MKWAPRFRLDGFGGHIINLFTGFGGGQDKVSATDIDTGFQMTEPNESALYRHNRIARRIVEELPKDATRKGWRVMVNGVENEEIGNTLRELKFKAKVKEAYALGRLHGGGALIMVTTDQNQGDLAAPPEGPEELLNIVVANRHEMTPTAFDVNPVSKTFRDPIEYRWQPESLPLTSPQGGQIGEATPLPIEDPAFSGGSIHVHGRRTVRFLGDPVPSRRLAEVNYWSDSVYQAAWENIRDYTVARMGAAQTIQEFSVTAFKIKGLANALAGGTQGVAERFSAVNMSKSIINSVLMDADEEMTRIGASGLSGFSELWRNFMTDLAAATGMPITKLFGQAPGGLSTDDASGTRNWNEVVADAQETILEPAIRQVVTLLMESRQGPTNGQVLPFEIIFNPLDEPTKGEKAETEKKEAEADQIRVTGGILAREEVRGMRFPDMEGEVPTPDKVKELMPDPMPMGGPAGQNGAASQAAS